MGVFRHFPYSNFHEMNMDEIIKIVKNMLEEWAQYYAEWDAWMDQMNDDWSNYQEVMNEAWQNMQDFINNYFDNLDVQTEINNKITSMVNTGEFASIVEPYIPPQVTSWLAEHITQPVGVVIDTSLSVAGACADAKATGDAIEDVKTKLYSVIDRTDYKLIAGYIDTSSSPVDITDVTVAGSWTHAVAPCTGGDIFTYSAIGGGAPRSWCFIKADGTIISNSGTYASATDEVLVTPKDSAYLIINDNGGTGYVFKGGHRVDNIVNLVENRNSYSFVNEGYVDPTDGIYHEYGQGTYLATDLVPVTEGNVIIINGSGFGEQYAWYNSSKTYIGGFANPNRVHTEPLTVPENAKYFRMSLVSAGLDPDTLDINVIPISETISKLWDMRNNIEELQIYPFNNNGYVWYEDGIYHPYGDGNYKASDMIPVKIGQSIIVTGSGFGEQYAWYDEQKTYITGVQHLDDEHTPPLAVPENAYFFRMSLMPSGLDPDTLNIKVLPIANTTEKLFNRYDRTDIIINCVGDSVTEGMGVDGDYTADYGKDTYPAKLFTILTDNNYDCVVHNYGHGGECIPDMSARIGAYSCIFSENITIPSNNTPTGLGEMSLVNGKVTGTKIKIPYEDENGNDYCVYFTQTNHDTNPLTIEGVDYILSINNNQNFIRKRINDNKETVIPKDALLFTRDNRNPTINIVMGGINDGSSLTLERYINMMKACMDVTGKGIVLGSTHLLCSAWSDVTGSSAEEKWTKYHRACVEAFGNKFLDLYFEFPLHAVDYALEAGYWEDKTTAELEAIQDKLDDHIIPGDLTIDGVDGNVHLNEVGYQVLAMLVYERLLRLNYITKQE